MKVASRNAAGAPPLTHGFKLVYGVGSMAEAIVYSSTTQFLLLFYNQVRGLPAAGVGLALAAGLAVNAVIDPIVGSWSDRTRSRLGRRHPFMFAAILPVALTLYGLFNPPAAIPAWAQLAWLAVLNILLQQALTAFHTPHLALGGELTSDYIGRTRVMSYNTFFLWAGDTFCWLSSFGFFFAASSRFPNGALDATRYPMFSICISLLVGLILFISAFGTRSRIPWLPEPAADAGRFSPRAFLSDVRHALANRNYVVLLVSMFFLSLMQGVRGGLWIYTATFYWQLSNAQITWFALGSFVSYSCGSLIVAALHRRFDKRLTGAVAVAVYSAGPAVPLALGWLGLMDAHTPGLLVVLIGFALLQHLPYSLMTTTMYSALADIADENQLRFGTRQEGILFSTQTFFARIDQAVGAALAGSVLTLVAFPAGARPGHVAAPVLAGVAIAYILSTLPGLLAAFAYTRVRITRASYAATRSALARATAAAHPPVAAPSRPSVSGSDSQSTAPAT